MENSPSRPTYSSSRPQQDTTQQSMMSLLAMTTPSTHPMFRNDSWDAGRPSPDYSRPRAESKSVALPSIRQTFPDLHLDGSLADGLASKPFAHKSPGVAAAPGSLASPEYVHSPNSSKRRRISIEDEQSSLRAKQVPRLYRSPERPLARQLSPPYREQPAPTSTAAAQAWASPTRTTASYASNGGGGSGSSSINGSAPPAPVEMNGGMEPRLSLPSLPPLNFERESAPMHVPRETAPGNSAGAAVLDRAPAYQSQEYGGYSYHHPTRYQSLSTSSIRSYDRAPFSAGGGYGQHYHDMGRYGDLGGVGMGGDAKQRKRRGNLPKETTDKLRAWFMAHLQHPYPTEEEKQDLMRQTGLQMNQISNWFINARRRQLPAMMNNARVEADAVNGQIRGGSGDVKVLASTERAADYAAPGSRGEGLPLSDGEGGAYDEDMSSLRKRRAGDPSRESV